MYTKKRFVIKDMTLWTRVETMWFILIAVIEVAIFILTDQFLQIPFTPVGIIGTAVAFIIGFQSNSAYGRIWEARKIWGGIVNESRSFGMKVQDFITNEHAEIPMSEAELKNEKKTIIYRHIAWLTALRYVMRQSKPWEYVTQENTNKEWREKLNIPEYETSLEDAISAYLSREEQEHILNKGNKQTALLYLQSNHLRALKEKGYLWEFSFLELENLLQTLFTHQGKSERIKNFPYPRQFASILHYFTWIFILVIPMAIVSQFAQIPETVSNFIPYSDQVLLWLSVPFSVAIMWIFHTMNRIGRVGENPFEGSANDVPISTISRGIEIDLRENLGESKEEIPAQFEVKRDTQM